MADVFLSYAREDRVRAQQVAQGLEAAGLDVFWDNEIPPGTTWADFIEQKLSQCKALIVLWSADSTKSQWVREEARMGRDKGVLIPVMIDGSQAPFGFGEVQAADLSSWTGEAEHPNWRRFVDAVRRFADSTPQPQPQPLPNTAPRAAAAPAWSAPAPEPKKNKLPVWAWVAGGVVATIVVLAIIGAMMPDQTAQQQHASGGPSSAQPVAQAPAVAPPTTDGSPQAIILAQLQQSRAAAAQAGFQLIGQPVTGGLAQGQSWNVPAELYAGFDYRVIGVCDRDCADLDLVLYDPSGAPLAQDRETSSQPVLAIQPAYNGAYTIQVQMFNCSVAPCYYALELYGRQLR